MRCIPPTITSSSTAPNLTHQKLSSGFDGCPPASTLARTAPAKATLKHKKEFISAVFASRIDIRTLPGNWRLNEKDYTLV